MRELPERILVVGGSGMLAGLSLRLAEIGHRVSVLARNPQRLAQLTGRTRPAEIEALACDYRDQTALHRVLPAERRFDTVICWAHDAEDSAIALGFARHAMEAFVHVVGSATATPANPDRLGRLRRHFSQAAPDLDYRVVILGFVAVPGERSRWLTHAEISEGVLDALKTTDPVTIVGQVEPWSLRP